MFIQMSAFQVGDEMAKKLSEAPEEYRTLEAVLTFSFAIAAMANLAIRG